MDHFNLDLNLDLSQVDTSIPLLPAGRCVMRIAKVEIAESKNYTGRKNLVVEFRTVQEQPGLKPETTCGEGYPVKKWYPLQQSDNPKAPDFKRDITLLFMAALKPDNQADLPVLKAPEDFQILTDCIVEADIAVREDPNGDFGPSNEIRRVHPVK